jgi:ABC-type transporter Mla MlaB component
MLRITIKKEESSEVWELEGKLSGEWVCELDRVWKERSPQAGSTEVHLKAISYIDPAGKELLAEMRQQGAEIRGCGCMVRAFVEEIMGRKKRAVDVNGLPKKMLTVIFLAGLLVGGSAILCAAHKPPLARGAQGQVVRAQR